MVGCKRIFDNLWILIVFFWGGGGGGVVRDENVTLSRMVSSVTYTKVAQLFTEAYS